MLQADAAALQAHTPGSVRQRKYSSRSQPFPSALSTESLGDGDEHFRRVLRDGITGEASSGGSINHRRTLDTGGNYCRAPIFSEKLFCLLHCLREGLRWHLNNFLSGQLPSGHFRQSRIRDRFIGQLSSREAVAARNRLMRWGGRGHPEEGSYLNLDSVSGVKRY
jgi:hypothetical protein